MRQVAVAAAASRLDLKMTGTCARCAQEHHGRCLRAAAGLLMLLWLRLSLRLWL